MTVRPPENFTHDQAFEGYYAHLRAMYSEGQLVQETVNAETRSAMVAATLHPDLKPGLYVEVNFGVEPYAAGSSRKFSDSSRYIGIGGGTSTFDPFIPFAPLRRESRSVFPRPAQQHLAEDRENGLFSTLVKGDPEATPLQDASVAQWPVREVFMADTLNEPGLHHSSMRTMLQEMTRVMPRDGRLVLRVDNFFGDPGNRHTYLAMLAELDRAGFGRRALVQASATDQQQHKAFMELWAQYPNRYPSHLHVTGRFIICELGEAPHPKSPSVLGWLAARLARGGQQT